MSSRTSTWVSFALGLLWVAPLALLAGCESDRADAPQQIYLITIDTLRADHVQFLGYPARTTPFMSSLAEEGVVFEKAFSTAAHTTPAHASLMSSLYPEQHGALRNGQALDPGTTTLASFLRERDYQTAAFTSVGFLSGLSLGYQHFDGFRAKSDRHRIYRPAHETFQQARAWIAKQPTARPLFVWIHLFDIHEWQDPQQWELAWLKPLEVEYQLPNSAWRQFYTEQQGLSPDCLKTEAELQQAMRSYDGRLLYIDSQLEKFKASLGELNRLEHSLWIITGDHGEGLYSHGYDGHGRELYREQLQIPLLLYFDSKRSAGFRSDQLVRHIDLLPTVAELIGAPLRESEGLSLLPLIDDGELATSARLAYAQRRPITPKLLRDGWSPGKLRTIFDLNHKYIFHSEAPDQYFDLREDPLESINLIEHPDDELEALRDALRILRKKFDRKRRHDKKISDETRAELQSLGYTE